MKRITKLMAILLAVMMLSSGIIANAFTDPPTRLLNIYGDGMLFKQNSEAVFEGTAKNGAEITAEIIAPDSTVISKSSAFASKSGTFTLTIDTPAGSYTEYTIRLYENGILFRELKDVVFGELWLASGQSNMQYPLSQSETGAELYNNKTVLSKWIRAFMVPALTTYKGTDNRVPADPQKEIENAVWIKGDNMSIYSVSAVAYFFAAKLQEKLDMPVGILNSALGGSSIASWLSRDAIDNNAAVKNDFVSNGEYYPYDTWNETERNQFYDMTTNYNLKIRPMKNFRISGMIWYQGETDIFNKWERGRYTRAFDLMQKSYTENFSYDDGLLPIVFTSLAGYEYNGGTELFDMNIEFTDIQLTQPESRALISIYDIPLDYLPEVGAIHPSFKQPVGERMADSAYKMIYNYDDTYTTATVSEIKAENNTLFITFRNTGSGLVCDGTDIFGFSIAGKDGIYVEADAEIVSADTVKVSSEYVSDPVSAAYAYSMANMSSNLYASDTEGTLIPVACFVTDSTVNNQRFIYSDWFDCENDTAWRVIDASSHSGYYNTWKADNAVITFTSSDAFSGDKGMNAAFDIKGFTKTFTLSPNMTYKKKNSNVVFSDIQKNYSDYSLMSFYVKNNSDSDVTLKEARIYTSAAIWYSPEVNDSNTTEAVIPADGDWHKIELDMNTLFFDGNRLGLEYSNRNIKNIKDIKFIFEAEGNGDISIDNFRFAPDTEADPGTRFGSSFTRYSVIELLNTIIAKFTDIFVNAFTAIGGIC